MDPVYSRYKQDTENLVKILRIPRESGRSILVESVERGKCQKREISKNMIEENVEDENVEKENVEKHRKKGN